MMEARSYRGVLTRNPVASEMAIFRQLAPQSLRVDLQSSRAGAQMTFDEAAKLIKKGDVVGLRKELQDELSVNLCNENLWTLLMMAAVEGNTSIGTLLIESG